MRKFIYTLRRAGFFALMMLFFQWTFAQSTGTIKGNVNRKGERIYHLPGQHNYSKTNMTKGLGERWFCSEAEAEAAGWRKATH